MRASSAPTFRPEDVEEYAIRFGDADLEEAVGAGVRPGLVSVKVDGEKVGGGSLGWKGQRRSRWCQVLVPT